jgi:hypothetical protein
MPTYTNHACEGVTPPARPSLAGRLCVASRLPEYQAAIGLRREFDPANPIVRGALLRLGISAQAKACDEVPKDPPVDPPEEPGGPPDGPPPDAGPPVFPPPPDPWPEPGKQANMYFIVVSRGISESYTFEDSIEAAMSSRGYVKTDEPQRIATWDANWPPDEFTGKKWYRQAPSSTWVHPEYGFIIVTIDTIWNSYHEGFWMILR